jgi:hypothetical protein
MFLDAHRIWVVYTIYHVNAPLTFLYKRTSGSSVPHLDTNSYVYLLVFVRLLSLEYVAANGTTSKSWQPARPVTVFC